MRTLDKPQKGAQARFLADQPIPRLDVQAQAHLPKRRKDARKGPLLSGTSHPIELRKGELWNSQHIPVPLLNCSIFQQEDGEGDLQYLHLITTCCREG